MVGASSDLDDACCRIPSVDAHVVLLNANIDATGMIRQIKNRCPKPDIVVLGADDCAEQIVSLLEAGASGYALKSTCLEEMISMVTALRRGHAICSPRIAGAVFRRVHQLIIAGHVQPTNNANSLSLREREILGMITRGCMNKEIARSLSITLCTVKNHVHNILDKLKVSRWRDAARYARTHGIVEAISSCADVPASWSR